MLSQLLLIALLPLIAELQPNGKRTVAVEIAGQKALLPDGSSAVRAQTLSPDGRYCFVTHNLARYHLPATQMDRGWMNTAALSVFDAKSGSYINTAVLDDPNEGAANPWGVAVNNQWIAVAHAGTHEVSIIPYEPFLKRLLAYKDDASTDLTLMRTVGRRRLPLKGKGPRDVTFRKDGFLEVSLYFAEAKAVINPATGSVEEPNLPRGLSPAVLANPVRKGEYYFNDATICFQKWQSCASCHPDGTTDGLTWDFPFSGGGLGHPELTPDITTMRFFRPNRTRRGDFHILLFDASKEIGDATEAYVQSILGKK